MIHLISHNIYYLLRILQCLRMCLVTIYIDLWRLLFPTALTTHTHVKGTCLTHKQLETHVRAISIVITDTLVLKHQAISIHSTD